MKTSASINELNSVLNLKDAIKVFKKVGFDFFDLSMFNLVDYDWKTGKGYVSSNPIMGKDYKAYLKDLRETADQLNISCNQSHAPFPVTCPEVLNAVPRAIEATAIMGGKVCVVHPFNDGTIEDNVKLYKSLLPVAKEFGVSIATENMWNWDGETNCARKAACSDENSFIELINAVNDDYFCACVDIGHAEMQGLNTSAVKMIKTLGEKVKAIHVHDNDLHFDTHLIPFTGKIDFPPIIKALKDVNYKGALTLEILDYGVPLTKENHLPQMENAFKSARTLADAFEKL